MQHTLVFLGAVIAAGLPGCLGPETSPRSSSLGLQGACSATEEPAPSGTPEPARTRLAGEDEPFTVAQATVIEYGAGDSWVTKTVTGTATCSNTFFGSDPLPNVVKACFARVATGASRAPTVAAGAGSATGASLTVSGNQVTVTACHAVQTAAAVYDSDGALVRTLWRKINLAAGQSTSMTWDYADDFGRTVGDGAYEVKVLAHNVSYEWEGVVGNTSNPGSTGLVQAQFDMGGIDTTVDTVGEHIHRAIRPISSMSVSPDGQAFVAVAYAEQQPGMHRFDVQNPQSRTSIGHDDFQRIFELVATDGTLAYFANTGLYGDGIFGHPENFIVAFRVSDDGAHSFANGSAWNDGIGPGNQWPSVVDPVADGGDRIRGMAVDVKGTNLYVAHQSSGIKILDKTTGKCRVSAGGNSCGSSIAVPNASGVALAPNGDLWVISNGKEVRKYTNPGTNPTLALTIGGFSHAAAIAISPATSTLVVADAGDAQQLKAYDTRTGNSVWVHGNKGGYTSASGPQVSPDKLYLADISGEANHIYVAFEPARNGEEVLWLGEPGNYRNIKFKLPGNPGATNPLVYADQIMYLPTAYNASIDKTDPTRVFSQFLEFKVDYSKPLQQAWTFTRNWNIGLPASFTTGLVNGPRDVQTTTDGRTFALIGTNDGSGPRNELFELGSSGPRATGVTLEYGARLQENMSVRYGRRGGGRYEVVQRDYAGADGDGNPTFGGEHVVASAPENNPGGSTNPYISNCANSAQEPVFPKTSTNILITFDPCANPGYDPQILHLGGIKVGGSDYQFRASPGGSFTLTGNGDQGQIVDGDGVFNLARLEQNYAGSVAVAAGRHVIYNYFGEFWNSGQSNQWMHWLDNGLFIGQFGTANYPSINRSTALAGAAGNTFAPMMVEVGGDIFVYHNDESVHAGVHRWRVVGLDSLQQAVGNVGRNVAVDNPTAIGSVPVPR